MALMMCDAIKFGAELELQDGNLVGGWVQLVWDIQCLTAARPQDGEFVVNCFIYGIKISPEGEDLMHIPDAGECYVYLTNMKHEKLSLCAKTQRQEKKLKEGKKSEEKKPKPEGGEKEEEGEKKEEEEEGQQPLQPQQEQGPLDPPFLAPPRKSVPKPRANLLPLDYISWTCH